MRQTFSGLFDTYDEAQGAVAALREAGIAETDISLVGHDSGSAPDDGTGRSTTSGSGTDAGMSSDVADDAGRGAGIGAVLGGTGGLLTGLGIMAIPGVGPVVAAGWLAATAAGAVAGAAVGGAAGGLVGAMTEKGVPEQDAQVYAEGVRRGGTLVSAVVDDVDAPAARDILEGGQTMDVRARDRLYRESGWTGSSVADGTGDAVRADRDRPPSI